MIFELLRSMEALTRTDSSTEPELPAHPVKSFLDACGLDTSNFPVLKFVIENAEREFRASRICIPLRIPGVNGVFETFFRVSRILEVPVTQGLGHRKFIEIEWVIEQKAFHENDLHPANSFLASEMSCPSCRIHFVPEPSIIDKGSVKISCPQCLKSWTCSFNFKDISEQNELFLDLLYFDETKLKSLFSKWDSAPVEANDSEHYSYFAYSFEKLDKVSSLEFLFEDLQAWSSLSNSSSRSFDHILRSFINFISYNILRTDQGFAAASLEKTDIRRKSEIRSKEESEISAIEEVLAIKPLEIETKSAQALRAIRPTMTWAPEEFTKTTKIQFKKKSFLAEHPISISLAAAALLAIGVLISSLHSHYQTPELNTVQSAPTTQAEAQTPPVEIIQPEENKLAEAIPHQELAAMQTQEFPQTDEAKVHEENIDQTTKIDTAVKKATKEKTLSAKELSEKTVKMLRKSLADEADSNDRIGKSGKKEQLETTYRQGMLHLKLQQGKEAAEDFENILKLDPQNAPSYRGLGLAYYFDQKFSLAIQAFEKYLEISKTGVDHESVEKMLKILRERAATASLAR